MSDIRVWLVQGQTLQQDYDVSSLINALVWGLGWVIWGLWVALVSPGVYTVAVGTALVKCSRTGQVNPIFSHFQNRAVETLSGVSVGDKIWLSVKQTHIDDGSLQNINGTNIGEIKFWATLPWANFLHLATIDTGGVVIPNPGSVYVSINTQIENVINQIVNGDAWYFTEDVDWPTNTYDITFSNDVAASIPSDPTSATQKALLCWKADKNSTGNITVSVNTSEGILTAPLMKMHNVDIQAGDIETGQRIIMQRDWTNFQMQSQLAQVPIGSTVGISLNGLVWEEDGVTAWNAWFIGKGIRDAQKIIQEQQNTEILVWDWTNLNVMQEFACQKYNILSSVVVWLKNTGTPTDFIKMRIIAADKTTVIAESVNQVGGSWLSTSFSINTFNFNNVALTKYTDYYIQLLRTGSQNSSNYYSAGYVNTMYYPYWSLQTWNGLIWSDVYGVLQMRIFFKYDFTRGSWFKSSIGATGMNYFDGIFEETRDFSETSKVTVAGWNNNQQGLLPWDTYSIGNLDGERNLSLTTDTHFGYSSTDHRYYAQSFAINKAINVDRIVLSLYKSGTPFDNCIVRIETDNNGEPSWTLLHANAIATIPGQTLSQIAWLRDVFQFAGFFDIPSGRNFWIVFTRSSFLDTSNYYRVGLGTNAYPYGRAVTYENSVWSTFANELFWALGDNRNGLDVNVLGENSIDAPNEEIVVWYQYGDRAIVSQMIMHGRDELVDSIGLALRKQGTPTGSLKVRIETNREYDWNAVTGFDAPNINTMENFGTTAVEKIATKFTTSWTLTLSRMWFYASYAWLPADDITFRIETDNAGDPSWTLVDPNAVGTYSVNDMTTTDAYHMLYFNGAFTLWSGTYWLVASRTWSLNNTSYFKIGVGSSSFLTARLVSGVWTDTPSSSIFYQFNDYNLNVRNVPSGVLIDPDAETSILASSLTTSMKYYELLFPGSFQIPAGEKIRVVIRRTTDFDSSNYFVLDEANTGKYAFWHTISHHNNVWVDNYKAKNIFIHLKKFFERKKGAIVQQFSLLPWQVGIDTGVASSDTGLIVRPKTSEGLQIVPGNTNTIYSSSFSSWIDWNFEWFSKVCTLKGTYRFNISSGVWVLYIRKNGVLVWQSANNSWWWSAVIDLYCDVWDKISYDGRGASSFHGSSASFSADCKFSYDYQYLFVNP